MLVLCPPGGAPNRWENRHAASIGVVKRRQDSCVVRSTPAGTRVGMPVRQKDKGMFDAMADFFTAGGLRHAEAEFWSFNRLPGVSLPVVACLAALLACSGVHTARAQVIDQYINADIPGYGGEAGVTVATRAHPEYEAQGVRLGQFVITPVLAESIGYDDNVTGTPQAHGSALIETNLNVGVVGGWSDTRFGGSVMVDDFQYPQQSNQGFTNWTGALGVSHDFGRDTFDIGYTHLGLNQTPRDLNVPGLDQTIAYQVDDIRADYRLDLGRIAVMPAVDVSYYNNFENGVVRGVPYLQSYRDRIVVQPSVQASYEFATRRRVVVVVRDTQADFDRSPPAMPRQNFNDVSALGGLAYDADGIIGFRLLGGYERRSFSSAMYRTIQAPIIESAITWTPTGLTTVTGTAARYIEDSAAEATVGYTETALKLNLDHEYLRNLVLSARAAYYMDSYSRGINNIGGGSQNFITGGLGAAYKFNRNLRLAANYTYSNRNSSAGAVAPTAFLQTGEVFGGNFSENLFTLTLRFAL